jgi:hypothetical protein
VSGVAWKRKRKCQWGSLQLVPGSARPLSRDADLRKRRPAIVRLLVRHFQEADRLLQQHGLVHGLRTLDALQLAVALDLQRRGLLGELVTADRVLLVVAPLEGLAVSNPEVP